MKIRPEGAELFYANGQTEGRAATTNLIVAFRNFANPSKNEKCTAYYWYSATLNFAHAARVITFHLDRKFTKFVSLLRHASFI
jgi:hypothetical protein